MGSSVQQAPERKTRICGAYTIGRIAGSSLDERFTCRLPDDHSPINIHRDGIMFYWDDRDTKTSFPSHVPAECGLCGQRNQSHVAVRDGDFLAADRLCSNHTLYDVIRSNKYDLTVAVRHDV